MQKEEYLIKNACYSVTKYYLCKQNNKRSLLGRKQRSQVARSFPNRYLFSFTNKVTSLFSISCILRIILPRKCGSFVKPFGPCDERKGLFLTNETGHVVFAEKCCNSPCKPFSRVLMFCTICLKDEDESPEERCYK
jgi:hypothetical protein